MTYTSQPFVNSGATSGSFGVCILPYGIVPNTYNISLVLRMSNEISIETTRQIVITSEPMTITTVDGSYLTGPIDKVCDT